MTSPQVIQQIEAAGGFLGLKGDKITYDVPKSAVALLDGVREHRGEVFEILRERQDRAKHQISHWLATRCARSRRAWGAERFLHKDYSQWCQRSNQPAVSPELFASILSELFRRDGPGWVGLCLKSDWAAARLQ
jgi:hypothetical protein